MTRRVIRRSAAKQDVVDLGAYLARDSWAVARRFRDSIKETLQFLLAVPEMGSPWEKTAPKYPGLRWWPVKGFPNHVIFYRPISQGIEVLRVLHASRNLESFFAEP
jgi:toxin ParE1/3/4